MLEGKAKITLTDVMTGKEEVHEQHNLVTNAIKDIYETLVFENKSANDYILPLGTKGLGGLMLFDNTLTENVNNTNFPSSAHLIGYCDRNQSQDLFSGSLTNESGEITNGYKSVWEFTTEQCNGTIKALSLTGINNPIIRKDNIFVWMDTRSYNYYHDGYYYCLTQANYTTLNLYKIKRMISGIKINENAAMETVELVKQITIPQFNTETRTYGCTHLYDNKLYVAYSTANNGNIDYYYLDVSDLSFDVSEKTTITVSGATFFKNYHAVANGRIYADTVNKIYSISIQDPTDVVEISLPEGYTFTNVNYAYKTLETDGNGNVFTLAYKTVDGVRKCYGVIIYPNNTIVICNENNANTYYYINGTNLNKCFSQCVTSFRTSDGYMSWYYGIWLKSNYIGTICNLQSPIVKDNTKTMKIEYSIVDS